MRILGMARISIFPRWLIMEGSSKWPDLGSPLTDIKKSENTSFSYSCTYKTLKVWKCSEEYFGFRTTSNFNNTTREVGSRDLFWWLTWPGFFFLQIVCNECADSQKVSARWLQAFGHEIGKTWRGGGLLKPPARNRVNKPGDTHVKKPLQNLS